ncbi:hypothetical protein AB0878_46380 [Amycolatopsis sp. NPDC047767]|uniref:hypothetical protein n=1 Tax=Amycolatopsis sp. NPDC047767 TaxID=3156765 RepID=UPI003452403E
MVLSDRGSISVLVLGVSAALIIGIGVAVDGARKAQAYSDATAVAEEAARAGGQSLDVADLATGADAVVVPAQAVLAARAYLDRANVAGHVAVDGDRIIVDTTITRPTVFLSAIGISTTTVHGHGAATLVSAG